ncbi:hypothetical protein DFH27DRAFT_139178 [Peziza echinospora]|nr:hypothetical protein DFH27DRAFT_139178 [Peziza echinospora]
MADSPQQTTLLAFLKTNLKNLSNPGGLQPIQSFHPFATTGIGAIFKDIILTIPSAIPSDGKIAASSKCTRIGGNVFNSFQVLASMLFSLNKETYPLGMSFALGEGTDEKASAVAEKIRKACWCYRDAIVNYVEREGVDLATAWVFENQANGGRSIVSLNQVADLTFKELLDLTSKYNLALDDIDKSGSLEYDGDESYRDVTLSWWCHIEGRNCLGVYKYLLHSKSVDPLDQNAFFSLDAENYTRPGVFELQGISDVIFTSDNGEGYEGNRDLILDGVLQKMMLMLAKEKGQGGVNKSSVIYVTLGKYGCVVDRAELWQFFEIGALPGCTDVVETVGAGDTFIAAVIFALQCELGVVEAGVLGNMVAGTKCLQIGFEHVWKRALERVLGEAVKQEVKQERDESI